jgi:hypothetical protein
LDGAGHLVRLTRLAADAQAQLQAALATAGQLAGHNHTEAGFPEQGGAFGQEGPGELGVELERLGVARL